MNKKTSKAKSVSADIEVRVKSADGTTIAQSIVNGFGQTTAQAQASTTGFIYTRSEYNDKGQLVKQYQDTGWNTAKTAATLYEYDAFGNTIKKTLALAPSPTKDNSPVLEIAYSLDSSEDGVYKTTTQTYYNTAGEPLNATQKQLISRLSENLINKSIRTDERGNSSISWSVFSAPSKITTYSSIPSSSVTCESVEIDGFVILQKDYSGVVNTALRTYTASGITLVHVDGRGNTTTSVTDLAGRIVSVTDASGAEMTTLYDPVHNLPKVITDALGNTSCYKYDIRGRKIAEWGTALQPACFGYDDTNNMTMLMTFRESPETNADGSPKQSGESVLAGDVTTWVFHPSTGLELSKTCADNTSVLKTYDAFNRLSTETDARGNVKTHSYEQARGLRLGTTYTVVDGTAATTNRSYTYNYLGLMTQVVDDAGTRSFGYNSYGERESDSLLADGVTHLITELRDEFGRSTGYVYSKNGTVQQTVCIGYDTDGRINNTGFMHGGEIKLFSYEYLQGANLLSKLTKPNGMTLTQTYESTRDLITEMAYKRGETLVALREYDYDMLRRPTARTTSRQGKVVNDTFVRNSRAELVNAQVNGETYNYEYDNVGNRLSSIEEGDFVSYDVNALNQYTNINGTEGETEFGFSPTYDSDGNQTMLKTETGIWSAEYNAENRTVRFTNNESNTVVECAYDFMGRRACKKVTINGTVTLHQRYIYRGYLQIACCDLTRANHPCLWLITWDETQPKASRPLSIQIDGTWYTYGLDLTKNVCELFTSSGYIASTNVYSPFGIITTTGSSKQTLYWNSENYDRELGLMYYIKRYYNPLYSMWSRRDKSYAYGHNLYNFTQNDPIAYFDMIGNVKGNPNHGGLNLYVRHDLDKEEKEDEERKNANTNLNNYINEYKDDKENTQITNPRCWEHGCKTVTFLIELGDPIDNFIEAKVGHATVSVGQNFYDFGPVRRGVWEDGGYYWADPTFNLWEGKWDANHRVTLNDVKQNIKKLAMDHAVVEVITCVCKKHADSFEEKLKQLKNLHYELLWDQCATTVGNLFFDAIESPRLFFATSPEQLFKRLLDTGNITCGPNKGKKPFVRILQEFDTKYKWEYEPIKVE